MNSNGQSFINYKLKEALDFIRYNIKMGVYDEEVLDGMTDEEIIEFANHEEARADWDYEQSELC